MLYVLRLIILLAVVAASPAFAVDELERTVQRVTEQAKKDAAEMEIPVNKYQDAGMKSAQKSADIFNSLTFQEKLQCEQQRIKSEVFSDYIQEPALNEISVAGKLSDNEKVYLFFSSSVPNETVHTYLRALDGMEEPGLSLVMKGFVPGERKRYLVRVTKKDMDCVDQLQSETPVKCERFEIPIKIQPSLFDKFEINRVPAVVYGRDDAIWKITGDMGLDYLLERINQKAESNGLEGLIKTLRGS